MKWQGRKASDNIEDRRKGRATRGAAGLGIGTIIIIGIVMLLGGDPGEALQQMQSQQEQSYQGGDYTSSAADEELKQFVGVVLKTTEDVWGKIFKEQLNKRYQEPTLVIFHQQVSSACGLASAATGPFYCPGDSKLYIDLSFYQDLKRKFQAPGDFAMAYVVAHEVAHHVQNQLGITQWMQSQRRTLSKTDYNQLSVRLELQADFFAGVWTRYAYETLDILEKGDFEEAINAAHQIGDDRLQKKSRGYVVPDSFTHGTSAQRVRWFKKGFETGDIDQGDTFSARQL